MPASVHVYMQGLIQLQLSARIGGSTSSKCRSYCQFRSLAEQGPACSTPPASWPLIGQHWRCAFKAVQACYVLGHSPRLCRVILASPSGLARCKQDASQQGHCLLGFHQTSRQGAQVHSTACCLYGATSFAYDVACQMDYRLMLCPSADKQAMQSGIVTKIKARGALTGFILGLAFRFKIWRLHCGASAYTVSTALWALHSETLGRHLVRTAPDPRFGGLAAACCNPLLQ